MTSRKSKKVWSERRNCLKSPRRGITTRSSASAGNRSDRFGSRIGWPSSLTPLSLFRSANKQEIIKAYRKLAQQWHPDNFQSEAEKKEAEKKFIDIASAKEVLTDPGQGQISSIISSVSLIPDVPDDSASHLFPSRNETEV